MSGGIYSAGLGSQSFPFPFPVPPWCPSLVANGWLEVVPSMGKTHGVHRKEASEAPNFNFYSEIVSLNILLPPFLIITFFFFFLSIDWISHMESIFFFFHLYARRYFDVRDLAPSLSLSPIFLGGNIYTPSIVHRFRAHRIRSVLRNMPSTLNEKVSEVNKIVKSECEPHLDGKATKK